MKAEDFIELIEQNRFDKISKNGMTLIAERFRELQLTLTDVSKRLLAEKIILALDDYGRSINRVEYGLPIDPDTKDFVDKRPKEMLKIVTDIVIDSLSQFTNTDNKRNKDKL